MSVGSRVGVGVPVQTTGSPSGIFAISSGAAVWSPHVFLISGSIGIQGGHMDIPPRTHIEVTPVVPWFGKLTDYLHDVIEATKDGGTLPGVAATLQIKLDDFREDLVNYDKAIDLARTVLEICGDRIGKILERIES